MLLFYFVITLLIIFVLSPYSFTCLESFIVPPYLEPPYRYIGPTLYPSTAPIDMLIMKKFLLIDGYRFQNSLAPARAINLKVDLPGHWGQSYEYPENYRQRTGSFKERVFVEKFVGGTSSPGASQATLAQVKSRGDQDRYLLGQPGDPIESSGDNMDPLGKWVEASPPDWKIEINYPNQPFSWGDIINRFYTNDFGSKDIVL
jgi:hypothetical protein